jgi:hypothetical protein
LRFPPNRADRQQERLLAAALLVLAVWIALLRASARHADAPATLGL